MAKRKVISLVSSLRSYVRGVAISALTRVDTVIEYKLADEALILTFDYCEDYDVIEKTLKSNGYFKYSKLFNIFDFFDEMLNNSKTDLQANDKSDIELLLKNAKILEESEYLKRCKQYKLEDGRTIFEYYSKYNQDKVFLRAITLGGAFLWDYTPEIELIFSEKVFQRFHGSRSFWSYFISVLTSNSEVVHIFQDAAHNEKGDLRDKFCALTIGNKYFNHRIAHGGTMVNIYNPQAEPIASWKNDEHWQNYDSVIFLTHNQKNQWISSQGDTGNLVVIPHESGPNDLGYSNADGFRCVYIASLVALKHIDLAIKGFKKVAEAIPQATLEIYGQGPEREKLEKLIEELSLSSNVFLKGYVINAQNFLRGAACSLSTSERESFGMPIIESYAYSCPVVGFDVNYGPNELIQNGKTGYKVKFGDYDALGERIIEVLNDKTNQYRINAYNYSKKFTKGQIAQLWEQLFDTTEKRRQ